MNPFPSYAPLTIDAQQIDKIEAVGGEVEVTLTAMPRDGDGPSGQVRIRFDLEGTRESDCGHCHCWRSVEVSTAVTNRVVVWN